MDHEHGSFQTDVRFHVMERIQTGSTNTGEQMDIEQQHDQALAEQAGKASKMVWVTFQKEGMHKYPAALTDPKLATGDEYDVSFLGHPHRHMFHFKIAIEVFHDDRDIEFIQFKRWILNLYTQGTLQNDYKSCEMMSDDLYVQITKKYPGRNIEIDVSEDGENGSHAVYNKQSVPKQII